MIADLLALLPAGGLPAVLAAVLLALVLVLRHLQRRRKPLAVVVPAERPSRPRIRRVLIVDDNAPVARLLARLVREEGLEVDTAGTGGEALGLMAARAFDVLVVDVRLPDMRGPELLERARERGGNAQAVLISAMPAEELAEVAREAGAARWLAKPFDNDELARVIGELLRDGE